MVRKSCALDMQTLGRPLDGWVSFRKQVNLEKKGRLKSRWLGFMGGESTYLGSLRRV